MELNDLKNAISGLKNADEKKASKAKVRKSPFKKWIEGQNYYQELPEEKKQAIQADVALWYESEAVAIRSSEYSQKVMADGKRAVNLDDARDVANETIKGFAKLFDCSIWELPEFQMQIFQVMSAIHLGVHPKGTDMNLNKGVFVAGAPQIGKTSVFMYLKERPQFTFRMATSYHLQDLASEHGEKAIVEAYGKGANLVIDEIGWEKVAYHYKKPVDVVPLIIHRRHERGLMTHMTSNMSIKTLESSGRYEPHIISRILKGCNIIEASGAKQFI